MLVLLDFAFRLIAAHLFVEGVEKLLSGGRTGECRAVVERPAETAKIQQAFRSAIERHTHAVEQVNDARRSLAHGFDRRLVGQKVAAINGVVKVLPGGVALAL